jgi:hypothetical protein
MFMKRIVILLMWILASAATHAEDKSGQSGVGFLNVNEALTFLKNTPDVTFTSTKPDGWLIANQKSPFTIWSFTPPGHYAYPAVVKRELKQNDSGGVFIETSALCEADIRSCDRLFEEFHAMNSQIRQRVREDIENR